MPSTSEPESFDWHFSLTQTYHEFFQSIQQALPQLLVALLVFLAGLITAYVLQIVVRRLVYGFDWLFKLITHSDASDHQHLQRSYANIAGRLTFWLILIMFIMAAAKVLGWSLFANWLESLVDYLPRLVTGLAIILSAFLFSGFIRRAVTKAVNSVNIDNSESLGQVAQFATILAAIVIGVQQLGVDVSFITMLLIVVIGVLLFGIAMAFAFGAKTFFANLIAAQSLHQRCKIGEYLQVGEVTGVIVEISQTALILDGVQGRIIVPAKLLQEQISVFSSEEPKAGSLPSGLSHHKGQNNEPR